MNHFKKKTIACLLLVGYALVGSALATPSTEVVISKTNGLHVGGAATDRIGFFDATPAAQDATTVTAQQSLMNHGFIASGGDYATQHKTVSLTAANINGMYAAPVAILAAPAAGKSIVVTKLVVTITRTSTAFASGGAVIFQYGATVNGGGTQALDSTLASTVVTGAAGTTVSARNGAVISDLAAATIQAAGLYISNATGAFTTGTGTAVVDVWYYVAGGA